MSSLNQLPSSLRWLNPELVDEITKMVTVHHFPENETILKKDAYVKVIPLVIDGLIKVFTKQDDRELLIYYIKPDESCIMSFTACLKNEPSKVFAITEEETTALLLPVDKINKWIKAYPDFNQLFHQQYNLRYNDLLDTINHLLFDKMDKRLYDYLLKKKELTKQNPIKITHRQIASELGTAREVISRVIKKLENEGRVTQYNNSIEIL